jgi:hypothetical protein
MANSNWQLADWLLAFNSWPNHDAKTIDPTPIDVQSLKCTPIWDDLGCPPLKPTPIWDDRGRGRGIADIARHRRDPKTKPTTEAPETRRTAQDRRAELQRLLVFSPPLGDTGAAGFLLVGLVQDL